MKLTKALLLMVALFGFFACDNEDNPSTNTDDIIGNWEVSAYSYEGTTTTTSGGASFTTDFMGDATDVTASVEFKTDGTYSSTGGYTISLDYEIGGQTISTPVTISNFIGSGTYEVSGSTLTTTDEDGKTTALKIERLEGDDMELEFEITQETSQQGATSTSVIDGKATLKRK